MNKWATLTTSGRAVHNQNRQMVTPPRGWGFVPFHMGLGSYRRSNREAGMAFPAQVFYSILEVSVRWGCSVTQVVNNVITTGPASSRRSVRGSRWRCQSAPRRRRPSAGCQGIRQRLLGHGMVDKTVNVIEFYHAARVDCQQLCSPTRPVCRAIFIGMGTGSRTDTRTRRQVATVSARQTVNRRADALSVSI